MKVGENIQKYRKQEGLSQEALADEIYVTRQTVSNWENNKSYPDVMSLLLLAEKFSVTLDQLIKGDIEEMKNVIKKEEIQAFNKLSFIFTLLFCIVILSAIPLIHFLGKVGFGLWLVMGLVATYFGYRVDQAKKKHHIQTYKEIIAFTEGRKLDEISKAREEGKRSYQKMTIIVSVIVGSILINLLLMKFLS